MSANRAKISISISNLNLDRLGYESEKQRETAAANVPILLKVQLPHEVANFTVINARIILSS